MDLATGEWAAIAVAYDPLKAGSIDGTDTDPHDNGIVRAMNAKYRPNKNVVGDPLYTVFVARLSPKTSENTLKSVFSKYGDIRRIRLVRDIVTGFSKGYAFIEYEEDRSAKKACRDANQMFLDGKELFVDFECERTLKGWIPRRFGGGFSGRKESGQLRFGGRDRPHRKPIMLPKVLSKDKSLDNKNSFNREDSSQRRYQSHRRRSRSRSSERHRRRSRSRTRSRSPSRRKH